MDNYRAALLALISVLTAVLYWFLYSWPRRRLWAMAAALPGPKSYPLIGNLWAISHRADMFARMTFKFIRDHGPLVRLWVGHKVVVLLAHPDDVQSLLGKQTNLKNRPKFFSKSIGPFVGEGLFGSRDEVWKAHRKFLTPFFHFKILDTYVEVFVEKTKVLMEKLDAVADGRSLDIYQYLSLCTLEAIFETAIGKTGAFNHDWFPNSPRYFEEAIIMVYNRIQMHLLLPEWLHWMILPTPQARRLMKFVRATCKHSIGLKLRDYRRGVRWPSITTSSGLKITSILDMMVEASEADGTLLSAQEMEDEVITLAAAGMETTATTMSYALLLLAIHPDIQKQVQEELAAEYDDDFYPSSGEDFNRLVVLERVIKETSRLFPVAAVSPREIIEDIPLKNGHVLPKGCDAVVLTYALHRNKEFFQEPLKFWPDRWLPENSADRHPFAYLPFGAGPRNCIGQKYALMQMRSALSILLRRYEFTTDYKMGDLNRLNVGVTLSIGWPKKYQLRVKRRL